MATITPQIQNNDLSDEKRYISHVKYLTTNEVVYRVLRPEDLQLLKPITKITKQGRPRRIISSEKHVERVISDVNNAVSPLKVCRTRSGRMSKPPKHILQEDSAEILEQYKQGKPSSIRVEDKTSSLPLAGKRKIASQNRCATCQKAFLGKSRMSKHLQLNPGHVAQAAKATNRNDDLWSELVRRAQKQSQRPTSRTVCDEFARLLYRARAVIPKLLTPLVGECESCYEIDEITGNALGVPEGKYMLKELDHVNDVHIKNTTIPVDPPSGVLVQMQKNDQNSLLNLLVDTEQDTFESNGSNSEEVMNVDQLVNERLKTFAGGVSSGPAELPPMTASLNLSLDLSLDTMFAYHAS